MLRGDTKPDGRFIGVMLAAGVGALAAGLVALGNPGNMGICGACFLRDVAGAVGLNSAAGPKIFRPEVAGVMFGALGWMLVRRRFVARSGSHAAARFFFGVWMAFGALVFLGCPFRMLQRMGGGDFNAWIGALGFVAGVAIGHLFERRGYSVGKTSTAPPPVGLLGPLAILIVFALWVFGDVLAGPGPGETGPPAHAPSLVALGIAFVAGGALSATGFCAVSAARQVFSQPRTMLVGAGFLFMGYMTVSLLTNNFKAGWDGQPIAHTESFWNILAMVLVGLTGVLAGGCPVRQIVMAGEGNGDAFMTVSGLVVGGALAHNLGIASSGAGTTAAGRTVVVVGLLVSLGYAAAIANRRRAASTGA